MYNQLLAYINNRLPFSLEDLEPLIPFVQIRTYKKYDIIFQENAYCNTLGFLNRGLIRIYYMDGIKEITTHFYKEGCLFTLIDSFLENKPSKKQLVALEDCEALMMEKSNLWELMTKHPKLESLFTILMKDDLLAMMKIDEDKRSLSPKERYIRFTLNNQDIQHRIPQKHIASYLGIEPQSLSRIRSRKM